MLKFKLSLLLKSAKFRVAIVTLIIAATLAGIAFVPKNKAADVSNQVSVTANKSGVTANGKTYYVIRKNGNATGFDSLFCIEQDASLSSKTYTNPINISDASKYFESYNSAMWIINNMYTVNIVGSKGISSDVAKNVLAHNLANLLTTDEVKSQVASKGLNTSGITAKKIYDLRNKTLNNSTKENALEFVEQVALWKYTKNVGNTFRRAYAENVNQMLQGTTLTDDEQLTLKYTLYALETLADKNASTTPTTNTPRYITLNKNDAKVDINNYKVGPYYLEANGMKLKSYNFGNAGDADFPVSATFTKADGTTVNAGKEVFVKNSDGSFYIDLSNYKDAKKVDFKIDYILAGITTDAYVLDGGNKQNLLTVLKSITATSLMDSQTISIPGKYNVVLKKVKNDGTTVITSSEATFKINGTEQNTVNGQLNIVSGKDIANTEQNDIYEIQETKSPEGFSLFEGTAKLSVKFKLDGSNYVIDNQNTTLSGIENAKMEISKDNSTITVYIPNDEQSGKYNVVLKKVKKDGTTVITSSEATFKINGKEQNTVNGQLNIASGKNIASTEQNDIYEIQETKAPEGFNLFDGVAKLSIKFKLDGKNYIIDQENVSLSGIPNARMEVSKENNTITVYIPNDEQPGKYNVELYKVDENGKLIVAPAKFMINENEKTTNGGIIQVATAVEVKDENTVGEYIIKETQAPENFFQYDGKLKLQVKMNRVDDKLVLTQDGVKLFEENGSEFVEVNNNNDSTKPSVKLEGTTIKIYVPNKEKYFDLSLRKFISTINGEKVEPSREPVINEESIKILEQTGTAAYFHTKNSIGVRVGDEVEYTIRVYNEGEILSYAKQITDYLPDGLVFVKLSDNNSKEYTTKTEVGSRVIVIDYSGNTLLKTLRDFIGKNEVNVTSDYYQEVKIICKVVDTEKTYITNRGEITNYGYTDKDENGNVVWKEAKEINNVDIDSVQNTIKDSLNLDTWYENAKEYTYKNENGETVTVKNYYPGTQDDDDFETVELLKGKYNVIIKKVDAKDRNKTLEGAYFTVSGTNIKDQTKVGPTAKNGEIALVNNVAINSDKQVDSYTIKEVEAPKNYTLYPNNIKLSIGTKLENGVFVIDSNNVKIDQKDVEFEVNSNNTTITIIIPDESKEFDLSLRKFITEVNGEKLKESRVPNVDVSKLASGESTTATYNHPKKPVDVNTTDIVTYTIRVFNEGEIDGYASKIMDDIPEGLEFVPAKYDVDGNPVNTNAKYGWVLYTEMKENENAIPENMIEYNNKKYVVTDDIKEADLIVTDHLSKENGENNLLKAFDPKTMKDLDYKDVKVEFKVIEPTTSDRIIINYAQITEDKDSEGNDVTDRDSTPNQWIDDEDDQDIEKIRVRYFDLALRKWVTKAIVYENGEKTVTETNHGPYDDPEPVVKVDLKNKNLDNVEVKFEYSIRIINEGEIAGYAKEISDYIPAGLKFVAADNPEWKEVNGKIVTRALENTLLQPGETADVTVILTWINGADNLGLKTNIAEISEDYNDWHTPDIDSTPNNQVFGEDDIDDAPVILAIRTGEPIIYTGVAIAVLAIVSVGAFVVKRRILK